MTARASAKESNPGSGSVQDGSSTGRSPRSQARAIRSRSRRAGPGRAAQRVLHRPAQLTLRARGPERDQDLRPLVPDAQGVGPLVAHPVEVERREAGGGLKAARGRERDHRRHALGAAAAVVRSILVVADLQMREQVGALGRQGGDLATAPEAGEVVLDLRPLGAEEPVQRGGGAGRARSTARSRRTGGRSGRRRRTAPGPGRRARRRGCRGRRCGDRAAAAGRWRRRSAAGRRARRSPGRRAPPRQRSRGCAAAPARASARAPSAAGRSARRAAENSRVDATGHHAHDARRRRGGRRASGRRRGPGPGATADPTRRTPLSRGRARAAAARRPGASTSRSSCVVIASRSRAATNGEASPSGPANSAGTAIVVRGRRRSSAPASRWRRARRAARGASRRGSSGDPIHRASHRAQAPWPPRRSCVV